MVEFTLSITCDNAAFGETQDERKVEIVLILKRVREDILLGDSSGNCRDSNGNKVGGWQVSGSD